MQNKMTVCLSNIFSVQISEEKKFINFLASAENTKKHFIYMKKYFFNNSRSVYLSNYCHSVFLFEWQYRLGSTSTTTINYISLLFFLVTYKSLFISPNSPPNTSTGQLHFLITYTKQSPSDNDIKVK